MPRYAVEVLYLATHHYTVKADDFEQAEKIGEEMSLDEPAHAYDLYNITSNRMNHDDGPADNED